MTVELALSIPRTQLWDRWYDLARWKRRAHQQLRQEPLCRMCQQDGQVVAATVADHIIPHKGDAKLFWFGELQSLCVWHHNVSKREIEELGFSKAVDVSGLPTDPRHPFNQIR